MAKVLIVENDRGVHAGTGGLSAHLAEAGFTPRVINRSQLDLALLREEDPEICVLDTLPEFDSCKFIETARGDGITTMMVVVSAGGTARDRIRAFELGADDYLTIPFSGRELVARVAAAAKRGAREVDRRGELLEIEELRINPRELQAYIHGKLVDLTPIEFSLLYTLALQRGQVISREELMQKVWNRRGMRSRDRTVDQHIKRLRQKLEQAGPTHAFIHTRFGVGYRLDAETKSSEAVA